MTDPSEFERALTEQKDLLYKKDASTCKADFRCGALWAKRWILELVEKEIAEDKSNTDTWADVYTDGRKSIVNKLRELCK